MLFFSRIIFKAGEKERERQRVRQKQRKRQAGIDRERWKKRGGGGGGKRRNSQNNYVSGLIVKIGCQIECNTGREERLRQRHVDRQPKSLNT